MDLVRLIEAKRDGLAHRTEEIASLVGAVTDGSAPDYQVAAWLMAVLWRGLDPRETADLTMAMARSGSTVDLSDLAGPTVDKHSTGGVGDKVTLVAAPLAAATGLTVAKMSGRGLGHTGGTLDKLESIPGLTVDLDIDAFRAQAERLGLVIAGQTAELAPADKRLYALRDVTGTVPSIPLIAASIMSKKIAAGAAAIALDVKTGTGAFLETVEEARRLARTMMDLGRAAGRPTVAALTAMDQPLGLAVGNALEVREAVEVLRGAGPPDLRELSLAIAGLMHVAAGRAERPEDARGDLERALQRGDALAKLAAMIAAQGGDPQVTDRPERLPTAPVRLPVYAPRTGFIARIEPRAVGRIVVALGGGRTEVGQSVDPAVGVLLHRKVGDAVHAGDEIAVVHARTADQASAAAARLSAAVALTEDADVSPRPLVLDVLT